MPSKVGRTLEEEVVEAKRKLKKVEKKITGLSNEIIIRLSRARSDDIKLDLLQKRLADKEALFTDLMRLMDAENVEAAIAFISIDIASYLAKEGTPALDKHVLAVTQQVKDLAVTIVETVRDEATVNLSFRNTLCNKIIDQLNGKV